MTLSERARPSVLLASALLVPSPVLAVLPTAAAPATAPATPAAVPVPPGLEPLALRPDLTSRDGGRAGGSDRAAEVRAATVRVGGPGRGRSMRGWRTTGFRQVGATWRGEEPELSVRTREVGGAWTDWQRLEALDDGPDAGSEESATGLGATDLWWADEARDLQLRVLGHGHRDLRLVVIDPGGAGDATGGPTGARRTSGSAPTSRSGVRTAALSATRTASPVSAVSAVRTVSTVSAVRTGVSTRARRLPDRAPRPTLLSRRQWGADESWRTSATRYNDQLKQVHVHHTVNTNDYSRRDVAPMIRGIYRYHTKSLGWSDIGYNFLVDRFGRGWAGRAGGPGRNVRGAHTLGFNENSTGVAVIGNFENAPAPRAARWKVATIAAWKLDKAGKDPAARARVWSHGSDRYPEGSRPRLPRIAGHRDTNETACPGRYLYAKLGGIREAAQRRADRFS